ncbi:MAG TPA: hypothetical protein VF088_03510 [Pyrinomonadaceae bacterium]
MKRYFGIKILALTLTVLFGSIAATATERPFSFSGGGVAVPFTDGAGHVIGIDVTGSGTGTHLGLFTTLGKVYFSPDPNDPTQIIPSGEATLTAADGDKLVFVVADGSQSLITGVGSGHFRFTGGTGKFANASGMISYVVEQNFATGAYTVTGVGSIDY